MAILRLSTFHTVLTIRELPSDKISHDKKDKDKIKMEEGSRRRKRGGGEDVRKEREERDKE